MKRIVAAVALMLAMADAIAGDPRVENVRARQIPDTKDVEVVYDLVAPDGGLFYVSATFQAPGVAPEPKTVTGDFGPNVAPGRNRRFVWDAGADWPDNVNSHFTCSVRAEEQSANERGVQLWENGPYWAECNVGATKPEEYGYYFWWGDTVGYSANTNGARWTDFYYPRVTWVSSTGVQMSGSPFSDSTCPTYGMTVSQLQAAGYFDSTGKLVPAHDAATAHLGKQWRMPTDEECRDLERKCDTTRATRNGVNGWLVTGKGAYSSKSIFLPAAGYGVDSGLSNPGICGFYWSSTLVTDDNDDSAWGPWFVMDSDDHFWGNSGTPRLYGRTVRPVRGK